MAFSSGFHPHPRISYANAAATGAASEAEYLEIGLAEHRDPDAIRDALNAAMPDGMEILEVVESTGGSLADLLTASRWQVQLIEADPAGVVDAVAALLAAPNAEVSRETKSGLRRFDVRPAVYRLEATADGFEATLAVAEPLVRPDDVVAALVALHPGLTAGGPPLFTRLAQGPWDGSTIGDPLA